MQPVPMLEIRRALKRDLESLLALCLAWTGIPAALDPMRLQELLEQALFDDDSTIYLALSAQTPIGFAHITFQARPVRLGWRCTIEELHAIPEFAGRLESYLLEAIVHECRERGDVIALYLLTQPDLEPRQLEFYNTLGFKERGREVLIYGALQ